MFQLELKNAYIGEYVPYIPWANTLFYLNFNQADWVFTDAMWHSTSNNWVLYNADWIIRWCWANLTSNAYCVQSEFNSWESFPSNITIMAFIKFTSSWNHRTWVWIWDKANKRAIYVWLQSDTVVEFCYMKLWVWWYPQTVTLSDAKNNRHHYAITYNWSTMIWYIDWVQKFTYNISWAWNAAEVFTWFSVLWWKTNQWNYSNQIQGYVDEAICEKRVWTTQEIQTYLSNYTY